MEKINQKETEKLSKVVDAYRATLGLGLLVLLGLQLSLPASSQTTINADDSVKADVQTSIAESLEQKTAFRRRVISHDREMRSKFGIQHWDFQNLSTITVEKSGLPPPSSAQENLDSLVSRNDFKPEYWNSRASMPEDLSKVYSDLCNELALQCNIESEILNTKPVGELYWVLNPKINISGDIFGEKCTYFVFQFNGKRFEGLCNANFDYLKGVNSFSWGPFRYSLSNIGLANRKLNEKQTEYIGNILGIKTEFTQAFERWLNGPLQIITSNNDPEAAKAFQSLTIILKYYLANHDHLIEAHKIRLAKMEERRLNPPPPKRKWNVADCVYTVTTRTIPVDK